MEEAKTKCEEADCVGFAVKPDDVSANCWMKKKGGGFTTDQPTDPNPGNEGWEFHYIKERATASNGKYMKIASG